jgi:hypothetical protein
MRADAGAPNASVGAFPEAPLQLISPGRRGGYGSSRPAFPSRRGAARRIRAGYRGGRGGSPSRGGPSASQPRRECRPRLRLCGGRLSGLAARSRRHPLPPRASGGAAVGAGGKPRPLLRRAEARSPRGAGPRLHMRPLRTPRPRRRTAQARTPSGGSDRGLGRDRGPRGGPPGRVRLGDRPGPLPIALFRAPGATPRASDATPRGGPALRRAARLARRARGRGGRVRPSPPERGPPEALAETAEPRATRRPRRSMRPPGGGRRTNGRGRMNRTFGPSSRHGTLRDASLGIPRVPTVLGRGRSGRIGHSGRYQSGTKSNISEGHGLRIGGPICLPR